MRPQIVTDPINCLLMVYVSSLPRIFKSSRLLTPEERSTMAKRGASPIDSFDEYHYMNEDPVLPGIAALATHTNNAAIFAQGYDATGGARRVIAFQGKVEDQTALIQGNRYLPNPQYGEANKTYVYNAQDGEIVYTSHKATGTKPATGNSVNNFEPTSFAHFLKSAAQQFANVGSRVLVIKSEFDPGGFTSAAVIGGIIPEVREALPLQGFRDAIRSTKPIGLLGLFCGFAGGVEIMEAVHDLIPYVLVPAGPIFTSHQVNTRDQIQLPLDVILSNSGNLLIRELGLTLMTETVKRTTHKVPSRDIMDIAKEAERDEFGNITDVRMAQGTDELLASFTITDHGVPMFGLYTPGKVKPLHDLIDELGRNLLEALNSQALRGAVLKAAEASFQQGLDSIDLRSFLIHLRDADVLRGCNIAGIDEQIDSAMRAMTEGLFAGQRVNSELAEEEITSYANVGPLGIFIPQLPREDLFFFKEELIDEIEQSTEFRLQTLYDFYRLLVTLRDMVEITPESHHGLNHKLASTLRSLREEAINHWPLIVALIGDYGAREEQMTQHQADFEVLCQMGAEIEALLDTTDPSADSLTDATKQRFGKVVSRLQGPFSLYVFRSHDVNNQIATRLRLLEAGINRVMTEQEQEANQLIAQYKNLPNVPDSWKDFVSELARILVKEVFRQRLESLFS